MQKTIRGLFLILLKLALCAGMATAQHSSASPGVKHRDDRTGRKDTGSSDLVPRMSNLVDRGLVPVRGWDRKSIKGRPQIPLWKQGRMLHPYGNRRKRYLSSAGQQDRTEVSSVSDSVREAWVAHYGYPGGASYSSALDMAFDSSDGSVIVTGLSEGMGTSFDFVTIKYDSAGAQEWLARYDGPMSLDDTPWALAVDPAGNVYVTGESRGSDNTYEYATIKYSSSGVQQWVARYGGPANSESYATALAVDAWGNVYVTGESMGPDGSFDYVTVKYDHAGVEQWVARYSGPANQDEYAHAIALDLSGNVYVTGMGFLQAWVVGDYLTISYDSAGAQRWIARYNGTGSSVNEALAVAVDTRGNVHVTGRSQGSGTGYDYATVKYDSAGVQLWAARYNGSGNASDFGHSLAIDHAGNVLVTGQSYSQVTGYDFATVKYDSAGVQQWVARYNGPGNHWDGAYAVKVDPEGNVYVAGASKGSGSGSDYAVIKYNGQGVEQWVSRFDGSASGEDFALALALDGLGNIYVTGESEAAGGPSEYATIKYNNSGAEQWVACYSGLGGSIGGAFALAVDASGNVYVTGGSVGPGTDMDYATIKYNSAGVQEWVARYNGSGNGYDLAMDIALDGAGHVYVTGLSMGTSYDYATIKYSPTGLEVWVARYNGSPDSTDVATALAVDDSGNVYVTGYSHRVGSRPESYVTIKYDSSGILRWRKAYDGPDPNTSRDIPTAIALDATGTFVYVTGSSNGGGTGDDYVTIRYTSSGVEDTLDRYDGPGNSDDVPAALTVDVSGNVYVTGTSRGAGTYDDYATIKYNSSLDRQWVARFDSGSYDLATAMAVHIDGSVYVTGMSGDGYATVKYDSSGNQQWAAQYNGPGNDDDLATAIGLDALGNVYVTGYSYGIGASDDYATVKYDSSGNELWVARCGGPGSAEDTPTGLAVDESGNIYVTGYSVMQGGSVYMTVKYTQSTVGVHEETSRVPELCRLDQNYPNPFNPKTVIRYQTPEAGHVAIRIYDLLGREVATLVDEVKGPGTHEETWEASGVASGVYLYRLHAGGFTQTRKLVLVK